MVSQGTRIQSICKLSSLASVAWISAILVLFTSCSALLYYPTKTPDRHLATLHPKGEDVFFSSVNGAKLHGWYFQNPKPKSLIVFFHGNGHDLVHHYQALTWAVPKGHELFVFDYEGFGQSEGEPSPKNCVDDGVAALRWANAKAQEKKIPLVVYGHSMGGAISIRVVTDLKTEIQPKLFVVDGTFPSFHSIASDTLSRRWLTWPFQWLPYLVLSDEYAPKGKIADISPTKFVVIHGENDKIVPHRFGKEVFDEAKEPKEFWNVEKGTHASAFWHMSYRQKLLNLLEDS